MVSAVSRIVATALLMSACSLFELVHCQRKIPQKTTQVSETKIRANFDCPEEFGYYPHPSDCTQYYVCVFGGALLESCTGGLMYSHELQTCDWPRNVGCDGLELSPAALTAPATSSGSSSSSLRGRERDSSRSREREDTKTRYVEDSGSDVRTDTRSDSRTESRTKYSPQPPPPPKPKAVVTSRGQPRQLQERQQEIIKQQQLYADVEESLPPAEEIENDRQQRVYRGQPSTVGQVQRDRDGYRNSNSLPTYKDRGEKIGVISFGTQSHLQHYSNATDIDEMTENHLTLRTRRRRDAEKSRPRKDASPWQSSHHQNNRYLQYNPHQDVRGNKHFLAYQQDDQRFRPYPPDQNRPMFTSASGHTPITYRNQNFQHFIPGQTPHRQKEPHLRRYVNKPNSKLTAEQRYNSFQPVTLLTSNSDLVPNRAPLNDQKKQPSQDYTEVITKSYHDLDQEEKYINKNQNEHKKSESDDEKPHSDLYDENSNKGNNPNQTSSYESSSTDEYRPEDDDLGPPPFFYDTKSKYEDIPNPFEDPSFDFDQFLEKLGSTTTTTTTTTPSTHRPVPIKIPVYENLDDEQSKTSINVYKNFNLDNLEYANSKAKFENNNKRSKDHLETNSKLNYQDRPSKISSRTLPTNYIQNVEFEKNIKPDIADDFTLPHQETTPRNQVYPKITNGLSGIKSNVPSSSKLKEAKPILTNYGKNVNLEDIPYPPKRPIDYEEDEEPESIPILNKRPIKLRTDIESEVEEASKEVDNFTDKPVYYKHQGSKPSKYIENSDTTSAYQEESRPIPKRLLKSEKEYKQAVAQTSGSTERDIDFIKKFHLNDENLKSIRPTESKNFSHHVDKHQLHNEDYYKNDSNEKPKKFSSKISLDTIKTKQTTKKPPSEEYEYYYEYEDDEPTTQKTKNSMVPDSSNKIQNYQHVDDILKVSTNNKGGPKYSARYKATLTTAKQQPATNTAPKAPQKHTSTFTTPLTDYYSQRNTVTYSTPSTLGQYTVPSGFNRNQYITDTITKRPTVRPASTTYRSTKRTTLKSYKPKHTTSTYQQPDLKHAQSKYATSEEKAAPSVPSSATATARTLYNSSQYNTVQNDNRYDPYYALYDDEVQELYRDVDYTPQQNTYSNTNTRTSSSYNRGTPATVREETPSRGKTVYNIVSQDIYQPSTVTEYADNSYQEEDYRQSSRTPARGDLFEINEVEDDPDTKRTTSTTIRKLTSTTPRTTTTTTSTTQAPSTIPPKKSTIPVVSSEPVTANQTQALPKNNTNPGYTIGDPIPLKDIPNPMTTARSLVPDITSDSTLHVPYAVVRTPSPFLLPKRLTTTGDKPSASHYITKAPPKSTHQISSTVSNPNLTTLLISVEDSQPSEKTEVKNILPTTYSPPKYFLKSILPKSVMFSPQEFSFRPISKNYTRTPKPTIQPTQSSSSHYYKSLKAVRKLINPIAVNHELESSTTTTTASSLEAAESFINDFDETVDEYSYDDYGKDKDGDVIFLGVEISPSIDISPIGNVFEESVTLTTIEPPKTTSSTTEYTTTLTKKGSVFVTRKPTFVVKQPVESSEDLKSKLYNLLSQEKYKYFHLDNKMKFRATVEVPSKEQVLDNDDYEKPIPDQPPSYKPKPQLKTDAKTQSPVNTNFPTRVSRVNNAIKSLIANGGTKGSPTKCFNDPQCKAKPRTNSRGRGNSQYSSGSIASNEVTVTANRGTPPPRARPTLKPSTSIVSKATEFVDIYRNPPRRPDPIYPQPQPDKTAAKCRKDVCLLPDCNCGGKEIPGDLQPEETPQIVLLTFDDAVNDLNKQYYVDIFENGRRNPNGCPISATFYVSHEWTDYSQVQNLYADGHELASHTVSHSFGEQFSQKKWTREIAGQREILSAYGGVKLEDVRGMRAPFLSVGGNKMFKMLYDSNFTYDSSLPIYENKPPSWPYTLDYKLFHDCMIPPCPTRSYPGVWEVPMVMWQDLNGGRCSMGDACSNPSDPDGVFKMILKNFERHYTTNRAPFGLFYHAAWFTQPHHKEGFINFLDTILGMKDVWVLTNWQAIQWVRDPTPTHRLNNFQPFGCDYQDRPKRCNNPKVCNLWHKSGVRYMRTCQPCPDVYPWTGNTGIRSSKIDNDIEDSTK